MLTVRPDNLDLAPGERVLDLGCGQGRHLHGMCLAHDIHAVGLDLDQSDLEIARGGLDDLVGSDHPVRRRMTLVRGNGLSLPFPCGAFDVVICAEVLEHIDDYESVLAEIARVLKPKGRLAVSVPRGWPERVCWALSREYHLVPGGHVRIFDVRRLRRDIERRGFRFAHRHWAHALHTPYWWIKCLFWSRENALVRLYHRFLVWDLLKRPRAVRALEHLADPLLGKSVVLYFEKGARA